MNLDREIAEKVMGWGIGIDIMYRDAHGMPVMHPDKFQPSTNIAHAMEVEAEMFRRGFQFELWHEPAGYYRAEFYKSESTGKARSESLPEAICRAALAALK